MFAGYLATQRQCSECGLAFEPLRADDAPAYFTVFLVGHIVALGLLLMKKTEHPAVWLQVALWVPVTVVLALALLPFVKGAVMGATYASHRRTPGHPAE